MWGVWVGWWMGVWVWVWVRGLRGRVCVCVGGVLWRARRTPFKVAAVDLHFLGVANVQKGPVHGPADEIPLEVGGDCRVSYAASTARVVIRYAARLVRPERGDGATCVPEGCLPPSVRVHERHPQLQFVGGALREGDAAEEVPQRRVFRLHVLAPVGGPRSGRGAADAVRRRTQHAPLPALLLVASHLAAMSLSRDVMTISTARPPRVPALV